MLRRAPFALIALALGPAPRRALPPAETLLLRSRMQEESFDD